MACETGPGPNACLGSMSDTHINMKKSENDIREANRSLITMILLNYKGCDARDATSNKRCRSPEGVVDQRAIGGENFAQIGQLGDVPRVPSVMDIDAELRSEAEQRGQHGGELF